MKTPQALSPNDVVVHLTSGYQQTATCEKSLEETRDRLRRLFDAVSDATFLFQRGCIVLQNENGRKLLDSCGDEAGAIEEEIYRKAGQVLRGLPVTLTLNVSGRQKVLVVHAVKALRLEEGNALLVTVVDLSAAMERTRALEEVSSEERRRIARDLHDGLSQLLASLQFQTRALAMAKCTGPKAKTYARIAALAMVCAQKGREMHQEFYEI